MSTRHQIQNGRKSKGVSTFLKKTYALVTEKQSQHIVRWSSSGIGFLVLDEDAFSKQILPKYFKHSNYSSFVRQLNMYSFHKIRENISESYFRHQFFERDNEQALALIKRKPEKKKSKNQFNFDEKEQSILNIVEQEPSYNQSRSQRKTTTNYLKMKMPEHSQTLTPIYENQAGGFVWPEIIDKYSKSERQKSKENITSCSSRVTKNFICATPSEKQTRHLISCQTQNSKMPGSIKNYCPSIDMLNRSDKNIQIQDVQEDKLSINNELQRFPMFATKEMMCPSRQNFIPFLNEANIKNDNKMESYTIFN